MIKRQHPEPAGRSRNSGRGRRSSIPAALLLFLLLSPAGCGLLEPDVEEITRLPRALTAGEIEVIRASNRFAFDLLAQANEANDNLFLSPLSASMALGMTMNGADGETWNQMRDVLGFGSLAEEEINASYKSLIELLVGLDPTVETAIGNSVWTRSGFPVYPDFLDTVREDFDAEAAELDFASTSASERINEWVRDATRGRIEDMVPDVIPDSLVMYLLNAIYFKGSWTLRFDPSETRTESFHLDDGSTRTVPLMTLQRNPPLSGEQPVPGRGPSVRRPRLCDDRAPSGARRERGHPRREPGRGGMGGRRRRFPRHKSGTLPSALSHEL